MGQQVWGKTLILPLYVAGKDGRANAGFPLLNRDYRDLRLRLLLISLQNHRINVSLKFTEKFFMRFRGRRLMHLYDQLPLISSQGHQKHQRLLNCTLPSTFPVGNQNFCSPRLSPMDFCCLHQLPKLKSTFQIQTTHSNC